MTEDVWEFQYRDLVIGTSMPTMILPYLITFHRGDSPFIIYIGFQVLLLLYSPEESHHSSLSTANNVICSTATSDKSEKDKR